MSVFSGLFSSVNNHGSGNEGDKERTRGDGDDMRQVLFVKAFFFKLSNTLAPAVALSFFRTWCNWAVGERGRDRWKGNEGGGNGTSKT